MSSDMSNIQKIKKSFTAQAENFENSNMNFSKQEYLDYTVNAVAFNQNDVVLEAAAGTCACGRSIAPFVASVTCLDVTAAMLDVAKREAEKSGLANMYFVEGVVENMPFADELFDVVISRLAFHHFSSIQRPFCEMARVLKKGGKLVIIDMEAAAEELREIEDRIETMRDLSHVKNISRDEFHGLYLQNNFTVTKTEVTHLPVQLKAWLELTNTANEISNEIALLLNTEINGGEKTGFAPYIQDGEIFFTQRWMLTIGVKD